MPRPQGGPNLDILLCGPFAYRSDSRGIDVILIAHSAGPYYLTTETRLASFRMLGQAELPVEKGSLGTFVPNVDQSASPDI
jgi:hypothetical protein